MQANTYVMNNNKWKQGDKQHQHDTSQVIYDKNAEQSKEGNYNVIKQVCSKCRD